MSNSVTPLRQQIIKDSTKFLSANIFARGIEILRSVVIPVLFSPAQLGIWNLMGVIRGYGGNAQLGLLEGMNKAIPFYKIQGKIKEMEAIKDSVFWVNLLLGLLAGSAVFIISLFVEKKYVLSLQLVSISIFLQLIFFYLYSLLRAHHRFNLVSKGVTLLSFISTAFIIILIFTLPNKLAGALIGFALGYLFVNVYWFVKGKYRFPFRLSLEALRKAFGLGIPLILIGVLNMAFISIDRWVIVANLGITALGYYSIGGMATNLLSLVPGSIASVLFPRWIESYSLSQDSRSLKNLFIFPLQAVSVITLFLVVGAVLSLTLLIQLFVPKYLPSLPIIVILIPGAFFLSLVSFAGTFIISVNRQKWQIVFFILGSILSLFIDIILLRRGYGIIGVAYGTFIGYLFVGICTLVLAIYLATRQKIEIARVLAKILIPYLIMAIALAVAQLFVFEGSAPIEYIKSAGYKLVLITIIILPSLWFVYRDGELFKVLYEEFQSWLAASSK